MLNNLREIIREYLLRQPKLSAIVASRIYPEMPTNVPNPVLPCLCFSIIRGSADNNIPDIMHATVRLSIFSDQSLEQAWDAYNEMRSSLKNFRITHDTADIFGSETVVPNEDFDIDGYWFSVSGLWMFHILNKST